MLLFAPVCTLRAAEGAYTHCATDKKDLWSLDRSVGCWRLYGVFDEKTQAQRTLHKLKPHGKSRARFHRALDLLAAGAHRKALQILSDVAQAHPEWLDVHVALGRALLQTGKGQRARAILDRLAELYDEEKIRRSEDLKWLAEALSLLDYPKDANKVFAEANRIHPEDHDLHIKWGRLLLKNHNPSEALQSFESALKIWPEHPDALTGKAQILFRAANNLPKARVVLEKVLRLNPRHREGRLLQARMALFLEDDTRAVALARGLLEVNPNDVDALSVLASDAFLKGKEKSMRRFWRQAEKTSPGNPEFWHEIARFGERFHRYEEIVPLLERSLALDADYFPALVDLGVAYSRLGDDTRARIFLQKARSADTFDQRAFYMTTALYNILSRDYTTREVDGVRFRVATDEAEALIPLFSPWIRQARDFYSARYGFQLTPPVQVEVFSKPEVFAIRAVGIPRFWAHGVCFGHVLAMRSPNTGDFNAREVLVHELAHAYHLQITKGRVPRWFTEGLAELDTMKLHPNLARETDATMAERLLEGRMQPLCTLSEAFVAARTTEALVEAYMQARWVLAWLDATTGRKGILKILWAFKDRKSIEQAIEMAMNKRCEDANLLFQSWMRARLHPFLPPHPFIPDKLPPAATLKAELKKGSSRAGVLFAAATFRGGNVQGAQRLLKAIEDESIPEKRLLQAEILAATQDFKQAENLCDDLEKDGHGGFQVSLLRARIHTEMGQDKKSLASWKKVLDEHPLDPRPLFALEKAFLRLGMEEEARRTRARRSDVDEHNGELRQEIFERAVAANRWDEAKVFLRKTLEVRPLDPETWRLAGRVALEGAPRRCEVALEAFRFTRSFGGTLDDLSLFGEAQCSIDVGDLSTASKQIMELSATHAGDRRLGPLQLELQSARSQPPRKESK